VNRRLLVPLALLILAALALAACGGGGKSAEDEITEVIETAATTKDPGNCTELQTLRFTEQNTSEKGQAAVKSCEESAKEEEQAEEAKVSNVSVNGEKATAEVEFVGGSLGSQTLAVALVEEGGDWKLDQIEGFAKYDGKALEETFLERFEESPEGLSKSQYTCIAKGIGSATTAEAEAMFLSGTSTAIEELAKSCA
jgi:ABC-type glycerol-3-phosphate transport system substrate-binding protein